MPRVRLFCPQLSEGLLALSPEESYHAQVSMRVGRGEEVILFDGAGREGSGIVLRADRRRMQVEVSRIRSRPFELAFKITLAVAVPRPHRQGYLVEKCTELGVAAIRPIIAEHSVVRPGHTLVERWTRRAIEAAKQSERAWVPVICSPEPFDDGLKRFSDFTATALTDPHAEALSLAAFLGRLPKGAAILVLVGPEGGWSDAEREQARQAGACLTSLSPTVLRTETAAVAVCAAAALAGAERDPRTQCDLPPQPK